MKNACWLIPSLGLEQRPTTPGTKSWLLRWLDILQGSTLFTRETHFCPWYSDRQTRRHWDVSGLRKEVRQLWAFTLHTKRVVSNSIGERRMHCCFCCQTLREYRLQRVTSDRPWQSSLSMTRSLLSGTPLYYVINEATVWNRDLPSHWECSRSSKRAGQFQAFLINGH